MPSHLSKCPFNILHYTAHVSLPCLSGQVPIDVTSMHRYLGDEPVLARKKRAAIDNPGRLWPNAEVPYAFFKHPRFGVFSKCDFIFMSLLPLLCGACHA